MLNLFIAATLLAVPTHSGQLVASLPISDTGTGLSIYGLRDGEDEVQSGPSSMAVSASGAIAFSHGLAPEVRVFEPDGTPRWSWSAPNRSPYTAHAATFDANDGMIVSHGGAILRFSPSGKVQWTWNSWQSGAGAFDRLLRTSFLDDGRIRLMSWGHGTVTLTASGNLDSLDAEDKGVPLPDGSSVLFTELPAKDTLRAHWRSADKSRSRDRDLRVRRGPERRSHLEEFHPGFLHVTTDRGYVLTDSAPSMYPFSFQTDHGLFESDWDRVFAKFDAQGSLVAEIVVPSNPVCGIGASAVDPNGDLFVLLIDTDCVHVVKFPLSQATSGFVAMHYLPTLRFDGVSHVALGALAEAENIPLKWDQATKTVTLAGAKIKTTDPGVRMIEGRMWVDAETAMAAGLNARWDKTGTLAYVQTQ